MIAGNVANTNIYDPDDKQSHIDCQKMFEEQIAWAKEANVDFVIAETIPTKRSSLSKIPKI